MSSCSVKLCLLFLYLVTVILIAVVVDVVKLYECSSSTCPSYELDFTSDREAITNLNVEELEEILRQRGVQLPGTADLQTNHRTHIHPHSNYFARLPNNSGTRMKPSTEDHKKRIHTEKGNTTKGGNQEPSYKEKLTDLVHKTGVLHVDELLDMTSSRWSAPSSSSSSRHLRSNNEEFVGKFLHSEYQLKQLLVEGSNEIGFSLLILVRLRSGVTLLERNSWRELVDTFMRFGIEAVVFDCGSDPIACERRNWLSPQLILALPKPRRDSSLNESISQKPSEMKEVVWHSLYNHYKTHQVVGWVAKQLANEVHRVYPADLLSWTNFSETVSALAKPKLRLLLVSDTTQTPILLSAISLRFRDRIDVGVVDLKEARLHSSLLKEHINDRSTYFILMPQRTSSNSCVVYTYGNERGEALSFRRLELFLKFRLPEIRNIFTISLTLVNLLLCIELFIMEVSCCAKHVISWLWRVAAYNAALLALWLIAMALQQCSFEWLNWITDQVVIILVQGYFCNSFIGHLLITHWFFVSSLPILAISVFLFGCLVAVFSWSCIGSVASQRNEMRPQLIRSGTDSPARPLLAESPYLRHRTRLSWIERSNQHSVVLINQFLWPLQSTATQRLRQQQQQRSIMETQNSFEEGLLYCHVATVDYINNLPRWRFTYDKAINARLMELSEVCSDEKYETLLLEYTKFPTGMIPSMVCSICLERYRGTFTTQHGKHATIPLRGNKRSWEDSNRLYERQMVEAADTLCGLPCGHNFHAHCVKAWLARDEHASCPICRWPCYKQKDQSSRKSPDSCGEWDLASPV